jgi:hypothetical protein
MDIRLSPYPGFAQRVRRVCRHIFEAEGITFLRSVVAMGEKRRFELPKGERLWRAQLGHNGFMEVPRPIYSLADQGRMLLGEEPVGPQAHFIMITKPAPHDLDRMMPLKDRAKEGRVNPKGIPCFYCATDAKTAINEVRPWIGSFVTLAEVLTLRSLSLVDCSTPQSAHKPTSDEEWDDWFLWNDINSAFSEPVMESDDLADYAPTQALAEAFRILGTFDGIRYNSKVGDGLNISIFDCADAKIVSRRVCKVTTRVLDSEDETAAILESDYPTPIPNH